MLERASERDTSPISHLIARAIEDAVVAISRLDARVSRSLVAIGWTQRATWTGYARALQLQGGEIDEIDVFSWGCGLPLPARPRRASHSDEFADLAPWLTRLREGSGPQWRDRLPFTPQIPVGTSRLLGSLALCHTYARREAGLGPWLALPDILRGLGLTGIALPCLVAGAKAFRWRATLSDEILLPILRALTSAAEVGGDRLDAMEADHRRGIAAIRAEFRPTSLVRLLALISVRPLLSPQSVAKTLDLTVGGAGKLLSRAAELKLVIEVSGRRAWKLYLAPDLAVSFGFIPAPRGRPPRAVIEAIPDRSLSEALDAFDREMAEIDQRLSNLGPG